MKAGTNNIRSFSADGRTVTVYRAGGRGSGAAGAGVPVIYLNTFRGDGSEVAGALADTDCPEIVLAVTGDLEWDHDMAPWDIPPIMKGDTPCTGGADDFLSLLTEYIIPETESSLDAPPSWRGLAGYSLAGLFAVYSMYRSEMFSRIASMSGSLWFPDFKEFAMGREPARRPDCIYLSLGSREDKTRNRFLKTVRPNTEELCGHYEGLGISTVFEINPGNHYVHSDERTAAGIAWIAAQ